MLNLQRYILFSRSIAHVSLYLVSNVSVSIIAKSVGAQLFKSNVLNRWNIIKV